jgi:uncharacterized protein (TIGR03435 family)
MKICVVVAFLGVLAVSSTAQSQALPSFEVAAIRPSGQDSGPMAIKRTTGEFQTTRTPVAFLIRWAYDVDENRLIGSNSRLDTEPYDVVAKIPEGELAPGQLKLMMQSLLADRFQLRVHRETRQTPSYVLLVDGARPKVKFVPIEGGVGQNPFAMTDRGRLLGTKVTSTMLANVLTSLMGRPVLDQTGTTQPFDFVLEWSPESETNPAPPAPGSPVRPSIFTALKEQLGLKVEARRVQSEVVVIDSVLPVPTEN